MTERFFWDDCPEEIPEGMYRMCVYADDTEGLYTEEECDECNVAYLLFPDGLILDWYLDGMDCCDGKLSSIYDSFGEFLDEYTAEDTVGLCWFAHLMGFDPVRYTADEA